MRQRNFTIVQFGILDSEQNWRNRAEKVQDIKDLPVVIIVDPEVDPEVEAEEADANEADHEVDVDPDHAAIDHVDRAAIVDRDHVTDHATDHVTDPIKEEKNRNQIQDHEEDRIDPSLTAVAADPDHDVIG